MLQWTECAVPVIASTIFHHFRLMFVILRKHASIKSSTQRLWPITAVRQVTRKFLLFHPVEPIDVCAVCSTDSLLFEVWAEQWTSRGANEEYEKRVERERKDERSMESGTQLQFTHEEIEQKGEKLEGKRVKILKIHKLSSNQTDRNEMHLCVTLSKRPAMNLDIPFLVCSKQWIVFIAI